MKTHFFKSFFYAVAIGATLFGCSKDDDQEPGPVAVSVEFLNTTHNIAEVGDSVQVVVALSADAPTDGTVFVKLFGDAVYGEDFVTKPAAVNGVVRMDFQEVMRTNIFTVHRLKNDNKRDESTITLTVANVSQGYLIGSKATSNVKLLELPEEPAGARINFEDVFLHLSEYEVNGYAVNLKLTNPLTEKETVTLVIDAPNGRNYGTHFTTAPAAVQNMIEIEVLPGASAVQFIIFPADDALVLGTYEMTFSIDATTGRLEKGEILQLAVRIEENDEEQAVEVHSIAELRDYFDEFDGEFWMSTDYLIEGVITSADNVIDDKTAYIQDETGGIMLRFTGRNFLKTGDRVRINLVNGSGNNFNGQKGIANVHDMLGVVLQHNQTVAPEVITFDQLYSGNYEGKRVTITGVKFRDADGAKAFNGTWAIVSEASGAYVNTYPRASFSHFKLPEGTVTVTGIVGDWGRILPQDLQDILR
ncbi:DUF5689 domain-containing protein [Imperialibacter roseus]|uniref:DUF5689 domain-containing protein n=1 Tax=Imperialibacter roseus TaxID=1324217 RepID=A0ABZ0IWM4_9BACT|nr:DUF5689 domain-containing protein [Imperialibacter roseus]WOK08519.1 DUF5689 domain-containing protein [Imperialibacter roseus]